MSAPAGPARGDVPLFHRLLAAPRDEAATLLVASRAEEAIEEDRA